MSELIVKWLNNDVGLSSKVGKIEQDFANGYLFGELLHKHGWLPSFEEDFINDSSMYVKKANFEKIKAELEGPAEGLGIALGRGQISEITAQDRGSSLRLLFQLRKGLQQAPPLKAREPVAVAEPLARPQGAHADEVFFADKAASMSTLHRQMPHELHAKPFVDAHTSNMQRAGKLAAQAKQEIQDRVRTSRDTSLENMVSLRSEKEKLRLHGKAEGVKTQKKMIAYLERDLGFEKERIQRERRRVQHVRRLHQEDCGYRESEENHGIGQFEKNLTHLGIDTSEHAGRNEATIEASNLKELYEGMEKQIPDKAKTEIECAKRMTKIKEAKKAADQARKERERRQLRVQVEQQAIQRSIDDQRWENDLLRRLQQETEVYRKEATACDYAERCKEAALLQRQHGQTESMEKSMRKMDESLDRMGGQAREERLAQLAQRRAEAEERRQARLAAGTPDPLDSDSDEEEENQTKRQHMLDAGGDESEEEEVIPPSRHLLACMGSARVTDYLFMRGIWEQHQLSTAEARQGIAHGGELVAPPEAPKSYCGQITAQDWTPRLGGLLRSLFQPPPGTVTDTQLPHKFLPVVAVAGSPTGLDDRGLASVVAKHLATEFEFTLLEPRKAVQECIVMAQKLEQEPEWPVAARLHQLGRQLLEQMNGGTTGVPHEIFTEIIFRKMELLAFPDPSPPVEEEPADKKKKAPAKGKDKKAEESKEPVQAKGVVLLGFPFELCNAASWEAAVRAYTSPLLRVFDGEEDLQLQVSSVLAPWWMEKDVMPRISESTALPSTPLKTPVHFVRLQHADRASLSRALLSEAVTDAAWDVRAPTPLGDAEADVNPAALRCRGYDTEFHAVPNPVDREWLYHRAQRGFDVFTGPLQSRTDILAAPPAEEGGDSMEESCCKQAAAMLSQWRAALEVADIAEEAAPPAQDTILGAVDATSMAEELEVASEGDAVRHTHITQVWGGIAGATQAGMREEWSAALSQYFASLSGSLSDMEKDVAAYNADLVSMQRSFLEFLQRADEKAAVLNDFLQGWPQRTRAKGAFSISLELEELSDRLWQFTDTRRAEAIEELDRHQTDGFWEKRVAATLGILRRIHDMEHSRFVTAVELLLRAYNTVKDERDPAAPDCPPKKLELPELEGASALEDINALLKTCLDRTMSIPIAFKTAGRPTAKDRASSPDEDEDEDMDLYSSITRPIGAGEQQQSSPCIAVLQQLHEALLAEKVVYVRRLSAATGWFAARLATMREQLDRVFEGMDDWIRDRVYAENATIRDVIAQLQQPAMSSSAGFNGSLTGGSDGDGPSPVSSRRSKTRPTSKIAPSPTGGPEKRRRRELLKALETKTLDVEVYQPGRQEGATDLPLDHATTASTTSLASAPPGAAGAASGTWTHGMVQGLWEQLVREAGDSACLEPDRLFALLLERRNRTYGFEAEFVPPAWIRRSEAALALLCQRFAEEDWGAAAVDVTEFALTLTLHANNVSWPSTEALLAAREQLKKAVLVTEAAFLELPLWAGPAPDLATKKWIFEVLSEFEGHESEGDGAPRSVSVCRLFSYLGVGSAPLEGFMRVFPLVRPAPAEGESRELLVSDLWHIIFSRWGRPAAAVKEPPSLEEFCGDMLPEVYRKDQESAVGAVPAQQDAGKKKGGKPAPKAAAAPDPASDTPPPPPEQATLALDEASLMRHPGVAKALCSHGALFCCSRAFEELFPAPGSAVRIRTSAEAGELCALPTVVPPAPDPEEGRQEA